MEITGLRIGRPSEDELSYEWGLSDSEPRRGVSVCRTWDDLVTYFSTRPTMDGGRNGRTHGGLIRDGGLYIVRGELSDDLDHDHDHDGEPVLLVDVEVVERRELTCAEVCELVVGDRDPTSLDELQEWMQELVDSGFSRDDVERTLDCGDLGICEYGYDDLEDLLVDPSGSYVVCRDESGYQLVWHDQLGEYDVVG